MLKDDFQLFVFVNNNFFNALQNNCQMCIRDSLTILPKLQAICKDYEDLNYAISELHGLSSGSIRVGAFSSISSGRLPQMIKAFHEQYPHIDFQLINGEYNLSLIHICF